MTQEQILTDSLLPHVINTSVDGDVGYLAVLSDLHYGLNSRAYIKEQVKWLTTIPNCKVIIGGDSCNTTTKNSKGSVIEETLHGEQQVFALVEDMKPLVETGQLIGIIQGNHNRRQYEDAYITQEMFTASLLGDRSLYKGEMGIVYFNVGRYTYTNIIFHKNKKAPLAYEWMAADVVWREHNHDPQVKPHVSVVHNLYVKKPVVRITYDVYQPSFQPYPGYAKASGASVRPMGFYIARFNGVNNNRNTSIIWNEDFKRFGL